nr:hypothetical protein [Tanacetum cinerariifolium]
SKGESYGGKVEEVVPRREEVMVGGGEVKGGRANLGVVNSLLGEITKDVMGERGRDTIGVDREVVW